MSTEATQQLANKWPPDLEIDGADLAKLELPGKQAILLGQTAPDFMHLLVNAGVKAFHGQYGESKYDLRKYSVLLFLNDAAGIGEVAFCPKVEDFIQGIPFEVPSRGIWKNGPGVAYFFSIPDFELIRTIYMR